GREGYVVAQCVYQFQVRLFGDSGRVPICSYIIMPSWCEFFRARKEYERGESIPVHFCAYTPGYPSLKAPRDKGSLQNNKTRGCLLILNARKTIVVRAPNSSLSRGQLPFS
ncbi:hypothetical protein L195_g061244, partial [Trifolium pratense]